MEVALPTKIEWAEETWNPVTGCTPIGPGCKHCYARRMAQRLAGRYGYPKDDPFQVTVHENKIRQPQQWKKPRAIFVCSMGDLFHPDVPKWVQDRSLETMRLTRRHTYMLLTKRPYEMGEYIRERASWAELRGWMPTLCWPFPNIWLGVTGETNWLARERGGLLLDIPAAVHFMSLEPLLEAVDLMPLLRCEYCGSRKSKCVHCTGRNWLDWVIVGEETGPGARPAPPDAVRDLLRQTQAVGVPFTFKRWSNGSRLVEGREWNQRPEKGDSCARPGD